MPRASSSPFFSTPATLNSVKRSSMSLSSAIETAPFPSKGMSIALCNCPFTTTALEGDGYVPDRSLGVREEVLVEKSGQIRRLHAGFAGDDLQGEGVHSVEVNDLPFGNHPGVEPGDGHHHAVENVKLAVPHLHSHRSACRRPCGSGRRDRNAV